MRMSGVRWQFSFLLAILLVLAMPIAVADEGAVQQAAPASETSTSPQNINEPNPSPASQEGKVGNEDDVDKVLEKYFDSFAFAPAVSWIYVKGDRGRFRQDSNRDDRATGGVEKLKFSKVIQDTKYEFDSRALVNYDYLTHLRAEKKDDYYYDVVWKSLRKYWDGSQDKEIWDPREANLNPEFQDFPDSVLHTDRGNVTAEFGKNLSESSKLIIGYELWMREGRFPTLRGEQAVYPAGNTLRAIAMRTHVDGISNTISVRLPFTVADKHNLEPKLSIEIYRDEQFTDSARYNANGSINQKRDYLDSLEYEDFKVQLLYNSFLSDEVYAHGGYLFDFLRNDSVRSESRPLAANQSLYVNPDVDNWRVSNTISAGAAAMDVMKQKGLDARFGVKAEQAVTDAHGTLMVNNTTLRPSDTSLKEGNFGESLSLTYRGLKRTTVYAGLDMEQRRLHWEETFDAGSHEIYGPAPNFNSGDSLPHYVTNINFIDFIPTLKLAHRFNSWVKTNLRYRWKSKQRQYDTEQDSSPNFYPGILGNGWMNTQELTAQLDIKLPQGWTATLKYQYLLDNITYKVGDGQQDADRNDFSLSLSGEVIEKLFLFLSGTYEYYRLNTPTDPAGGNRWAPGEGAYDFNGDYLILSVNPTYQLTTHISTFLTYQITNSVGDNSNVLNEVQTGFRYGLNDTTSFEGRYEMFHFDDQRGKFNGGSPKGFDDDYLAHGVSLVLKKAFA